MITRPQKGERKWLNGAAWRGASEAVTQRERPRLLPPSLAPMNSPRQVSHPGILRVFQTRDQTRAFYDKISRVYDLLSERSEAPMRKAGLDLLQPHAGESILEVGFGTGHTLIEIAEAIGLRGTVFGMDLSDKMTKLAKDNLAKAGMLQRARLRCGDAAKLPYLTGSLDAVFMSFTLELFDTPEIPEVLGECRRVLRRGGRIVVVGMSKHGAQGGLVNVFEWAHKHFPQFLDCRPIYVRRALVAAGFAVRRALTRRMWVPVEIVLGVKT
jgi:ubiquinone/menaquinone biosynthesis C-methylase UbiE